MSVLVREKGDSEAPVVLYSKGADSVIYTNLAHTSGLLPAEYESLPTAEPTCGEVTQDHLNTYARQGLRTLCLARRVCVCVFVCMYECVCECVHACVRVCVCPPSFPSPYDG